MGVDRFGDKQDLGELSPYRSYKSVIFFLHRPTYRAKWRYTVRLGKNKRQSIIGGWTKHEAITAAKLHIERCYMEGTWDIQSLTTR